MMVTSESFDCNNACHLPLIAKLQKMCFIVKWVADFLMHRVQYVVVNGESSNITPVLSGVPQGSVLGPMLFILLPHAHSMTDQKLAKYL